MTTTANVKFHLFSRCPYFVFCTACTSRDHFVHLWMYICSHCSHLKILSQNSGILYHIKKPNTNPFIRYMYKKLSLHFPDFLFAQPLHMSLPNTSPCRYRREQAVR